MSQLRALIWLKWMLFRNAMRSRKAVAGRVASLIGTLAALSLSLLIAGGLGVATYFLLAPNGVNDAGDVGRSWMARSIFMLIVFTSVYIMWAIVPLSIGGGGGGGQFEPRSLLLYPISLGKLFAIDLISEITSLASIFAVPVLLSISFAAGLATGSMLLALLAGCGAVVFGITFAKLVSISVAALMQGRRTRGETLLATIGALVGLSGAFMGQLVPHFSRHVESLRALRWTPPGALADALTVGLTDRGLFEYAQAIAALALYSSLFIAVSYLISQRMMLNAGGAVKRSKGRIETATAHSYAGWSMPLLSGALSSVIEKELRYAWRNAQVRTLALMPLILIGIRLVQRSRLYEQETDELPSSIGPLMQAFTDYGEGWMHGAGVLYVFLILSSISCNQFAFEGAGMRSLVLSPIDRRTILLGKNIAAIIIAFALTVMLLIINQLAFHDLTFPAITFAALCFPLFAAMFAIIGNWLSIFFPKRLQFGKKLNASGITGLLLIPIFIVMTVPPLLSILASYLTQSLPVKYATLAAFAVGATLTYCLLLKSQGCTLARREIEILEAVSGKTDD